LKWQLIKEKDDSLEKVKQAEEKAQKVWVLMKYLNSSFIMWLTFLNYVMDIRTMACKVLIL
jgi:hypothetical protein